MAKLKFGSKAWRAKYMKKTKTNRPKRKAKQRKKTASHRSGTAAKRKRMAEMLRSNPPRSWTKVKAVRVIRKGGRDVLEIKK